MKIFSLAQSTGDLNTVSTITSIYIYVK